MLFLPQMMIFSTRAVAHLMCILYGRFPENARTFCLPLQARRLKPYAYAKRVEREREKTRVLEREKEHIS